MVMIGTDSHKRTHTVVALDEVGRRLGTKTVRTNAEGHLVLVEWATQFADHDEHGVRFALEDCRHLTRRLESDLLAAGQRVLRVPTRLMAGARRSSREPGKSDPIDAEAVALAALRHPDLPVAELDGPAREVKLLSDHRHDLVVQRSRIAQQVRWHLHELDPDLMIPSRGLRRQKVVRELLVELGRFDGVVARLARRHLLRCQELTTQINDLERELRELVRQLAPSLLQIPGCGVLSAAVIVGETAGVHRFRDKDAYARFTGTAPVPVCRIQRRQGTAQPRRQPVGQLRPAHDRGDPGPRRRARPALPGQAVGPRQGPRGRTETVAPAPFRCRLRGSSRRPARSPAARLVASSTRGLT
ncbi:unannotated protein [freshwater metagenome]|uniref:Unannotated protein n=1 Tax=freshwater metagenome TaxID=449393 RepID=A0A6J6W224_9ZZZZ